MPRKFWILFVIMISSCFCNKVNDIDNVIQGFQLKHPVIWKSKEMFDFKMIKLMSHQIQYSKIIHSINFKKRESVLNLVIDIKDLDGFRLDQISKMAKMASTIIILIDELHFDTLMQNLKVEIDTKLYVIKRSTFEVFETYCINSVTVQEKLGILIDGLMKWAKNIEKSFSLRRSNFHGKQIIAMTEETGVSIMFDPLYKKQAQFIPENNTYLVNGFVSGVNYDILIYLEKELNFSTRLYKRKDGEWGYVSKQQNETYSAFGMVGNLYYQEADMIVADLTMTLHRTPYIDFLIAMSTDDAGLFLTSQVSGMAFDFDVFFAPFR